MILGNSGKIALFYYIVMRWIARNENPP